MADAKEDFTVDRTGDRPVRKDNRTMLHMMHQELGKVLGIGAAKDRVVSGQGGERQGLMDAVDEAVTGAPAPGTE